MRKELIRGQRFSIGVALILILGAFVLPLIPSTRATTDNANSVSTPTSVPLTSTNSSSIPLGAVDLGCGYHSTLNGGGTVATSPAGDGVSVSIGEPSWLQVCNTASNGGTNGVSVSVSFVAFEVFPITITAAPNLTFTLEAGAAVPTPQQQAIGVRSNTLWTGFDPVNVTTGPDGIARSNFTLAGAVMPFVANDISNVMLPITARSSDGKQTSVGLPIEFTGSGVGGSDLIHIFQTPGAILFSGTLQGSPDNAMQYAYGIVYAPTSRTGASPVPVSLNVTGSWNGGVVGRLPPDVNATIVPSRFDLSPNQVLYFWVDETNTLGNGSGDYTFATKENVGNSTFLEPLAVSIAPSGLYAHFGIYTAPGANISTGSIGGVWAYLIPVSVVAVIASVVAVGVVSLKRRHHSKGPSVAGEKTTLAD